MTNRLLNNGAAAEGKHDAVCLFSNNCLSNSYSMGSLCNNPIVEVFVCLARGRTGGGVAYGGQPSHNRA